MARRVKTGLVGCSALVLKGILPHLSQPDARERIDVVAVCDIAAERAKAVAEKWEVREHYTDVEEMLKKADIELALVTTPVPLHYQNGMAVLRAQKHLYLQKTMTMTTAEASEIIEEAKKRKLKLVVAPSQLNHTGFQRIKQWIDEGYIGKPFWSLTANAFGGRPAAGPTGDPLKDIDHAWYIRPGGGALYQTTCYSLHTLTSLFGPAKRVTALSGTAVPELQIGDRKVKVEEHDNSLVLLDFGNATYALACGGSWHGPQCVEWGKLAICGFQGYIDSLEVEPKSGWVVRFDIRSRQQPPGAKSAGDGRWEASFPLAEVPGLQGAHSELPEQHVYLDILQMADAIVNDKPIQRSGTGEQGRHAVEIVEKTYLSAKTGQAQELTTSF